MKKTILSRATLGRLPGYLRYIRSRSDEMISAAEMARVMNLGEVTVRKDMRCISGQGRPKIGYSREELLRKLENILCTQEYVPVVIAGAGKLGGALMRYEGFEEYGLHIIAGFDTTPREETGKGAPFPVFALENMKPFCRANNVRIGVITGPANAAQTVCDAMIDAGITAIWNFAPCRLTVPDEVIVRNENLALSLAHLCESSKKRTKTS